MTRIEDKQIEGFEKKHDTNVTRSTVDIYRQKDITSELISKSAPPKWGSAF